MSETEKIETTSSERMDVDSNVENVENTVASSEKMDVEEVEKEVEEEHPIVASSSESGVQNIENTETVEEERPSSGENTETAEKMDVEEAEKEEDEMLIIASSNSGTQDIEIAKVAVSKNETKVHVDEEDAPPVGTLKPGAMIRAPRGRSKRLSNGVVVNTRRSKVTVRWNHPGNTTSRVHIDDIVFLADGEVVEDSDSDMDYDLTQLEIERRAKDDALRRTETYYKSVRHV